MCTGHAVGDADIEPLPAMPDQKVVAIDVHRTLDGRLVTAWTFEFEAPARPQVEPLLLQRAEGAAHCVFAAVRSGTAELVPAP